MLNDSTTVKLQYNVTCFNGNVVSVNLKRDI